MTVLRNDQWWMMPDSFVDALDIEKLGKGAIELLRDMVVSRPTEFGRLRKLFLRSLKRPITLLPRQEKAIVLANEARQLGFTETVYVADKLGINRHSAYKLLQRAEQRLLIAEIQNGLSTKMETSDDNMGIYSDTQAKIDIDASQIDKIYGGLMVDCAVCQKRCRAKYAICHECATTYGKTQDEREYWLQELIKDIKRVARQDAKQIYFDQRYGVNMDVSEVGV